MRKLRVTLVMFLVAAALACVLWGWQRASAKVSLHGLAKLGDVEGLRKALSDGLDPNEVEHDRHKMMGGWTPLMYAAEGGHFDCVAALIDAGADVNAEDTFTQPVLAYAAESPEIVELLLSHGAYATRCARGVQHSAISEAFRLRQARSLQLILDAGVASSSECLRYTLFEYTLGSAPRPVDDAVLAILIRHTQGDLLDQGPALLWTAAESNAIESARLLLGFGVGVDARSPIGTTPLMAAAGSGSVEVVELLLDGGADRTLKDKAGKTALDYVAVAETKGVAAERAAALRRMLSIGDDGG